MDWTVEYTKKVKMELQRQVSAGLITREDIAVIRTWVRSIEEKGLKTVQNDDWNDHPLTAEWAGYRSASFSPAGRIIYKVQDRRLVVYVVRVTATHDYRR